MSFLTASATECHRQTFDAVVYRKKTSSLFYLQVLPKIVRTRSLSRRRCNRDNMVANPKLLPEHRRWRWWTSLPSCMPAFNFYRRSQATDTAERRDNFVISCPWFWKSSPNIQLTYRQTARNDVWCPTKCGNLRYLITFKIIWANQKTELFEYYCLRARAMVWRYGLFRHFVKHQTSFLSIR